MPRIDRIVAYVAEDTGPDDEGIMAFKMRDGTWMPLVGADSDRIESLRPYAEAISEATGKTFKLLEFSVRKDITGGTDES